MKHIIDNLFTPSIPQQIENLDSLQARVAAQIARNEETIRRAEALLVRWQGEGQSLRNASKTLGKKNDK